MEEKTIVITKQAENAILGQENVFGWEMKSKRDVGKFLFFTYTQYTLVRDRNPEDVTQAHVDIENRWNNEFNVWNDFILGKMKMYVILELIGYVLIFAGLIMMMLAMDSIGLLVASIICELIGIAICIPALVIFTKNGSKRIKKMNEISSNMRQVNALRKNK